MYFFLHLYRFFCSLKLAVFTLSTLILLLAIGTFYESARGREAAQELIYDSVYMNVALALLALNILAVMLDRLPWKKRHSGFLLAHFGILFVIAGALITRFYGVDGYIRLKPQEEGQYITAGHAFLNVYASFDGANLSQLYRKRAFFFRHPPKKTKVDIIQLGSLTLKITDFYPSAIVRESYKPSSRGGVALRFLLNPTGRKPTDRVPHCAIDCDSVLSSQGASLEDSPTSRVDKKQENPVLDLDWGSNKTSMQWLFLPPYQEQVELSLGPAKIFLMKELPETKNMNRSLKTKAKDFIPTSQAHQQLDRGSNKTSKTSPYAGPALLLAPMKGKGSALGGFSTSKVDKKQASANKISIRYQLIRSAQIVKEGTLKKGDSLKTGWMDLQFRIVEYWPQALPHRVFTPMERANDQTMPAIQVAFQGKTRWMGLNSQLFFFDKDKVYIVAYGQEQKKMDFTLKLKNFKVQYYPFSRKAKSYESEVKINEDQSVLISMNQPLKWGAYTVYQSGFEENDNGEVLASVFSVNKDPGRWIKYFGSGLIVLGILVLFIRRNLKVLKAGT